MPITPKPNSALVLVGHGSTQAPDSAAPCHRHAGEIRRRSLFGAVHCVFWKEEPPIRAAWHLTDLPELYLVPVFISEGHFTREVIPRELGLTGPTTRAHHKTLHCCAPVGSHPAMTSLLLHHAAEAAPDAPPAHTTLVIAGHGTRRNPNSRTAIEAQVAQVRHSNAGYAAVIDAYMEEPPLIADWHQLAPTDTVVVVPFFIADGLHARHDIPALLGIPAASDPDSLFRRHPHHLRGKSLHYSHAIGTDPRLAGVILDQVARFDHQHPHTT